MSGNESARASNSYTVESGDTLYAIGRKLGVPENELAAFANQVIDANESLNSPGDLRAGQVLRVSADENVPEGARPENGIHVVVSGDTFSEIAKQYGVTVEELRSVNIEITNIHDIDVSQHIRIPLPFFEEAQQQAEQNNPTYIVRSGDAFSKIAERHGMTQAELQRLNPQITNIHRIDVGQEINVSGQALASANTQSQQPSNRDSNLPAGSHPGGLHDPSERSITYNMPESVSDRGWAAVRNDPLTATFQNVAYEPNNLPLIVIDPGHGSYKKTGALDRGADSMDGRLTEVDVVDPVAARLGEMFAEAGYRVIYTRNPEEIYRMRQGESGGGDLASRAYLGHEVEDIVGAPYTVFVSLHANSLKGTAAHGMEVVVQEGTEGTAYGRESRALAQSVFGCLEGLEGVTSREVKEYDRSVLRNMGRDNQVPDSQADAACLAEFAFLSSDADAARLERIMNNPEDAARRMFNGTHNYIRERSPELFREHEARQQIARQNEPQQPRIILANAGTGNTTNFLRQASIQAGFAPEFLERLAGTESSGNALAYNTDSGASGMFQITDGSILYEMVFKYAEDCGMGGLKDLVDWGSHTDWKYVAVSEDAAETLTSVCFDERASALLVAASLREQSQTLSQELGRDLNQTDVYLLHFLGPTGSKRLLQAYDNPAYRNHRAADYMEDPKDVQDNINVFRDSATGRYRSLQEIYEYVEERMTTEPAFVDTQPQANLQIQAPGIDV